MALTSEVAPRLRSALRLIDDLHAHLLTLLLTQLGEYDTQAPAALSDF